MPHIRFLAQSKSREELPTCEYLEHCLGCRERKGIECVKSEKRLCGKVGRHGRWNENFRLEAATIIHSVLVRAIASASSWRNAPAWVRYRLKTPRSEFRASCSATWMIARRARFSRRIREISGAISLIKRYGELGSAAMTKVRLNRNNRVRSRRRNFISSRAHLRFRGFVFVFVWEKVAEITWIWLNLSSGVVDWFYLIFFFKLWKASQALTGANLIQWSDLKTGPEHRIYCLIYISITFRIAINLVPLARSWYSSQSLICDTNTKFSSKWSDPRIYY